MLHGLRQFGHKLRIEGFYLLIGNMEFFLNRCQHSLHYDLHGFMVGHVSNFGYHDVEQLAQRSIVFIITLGNCQKHIAGEYHGNMGGKTVVRKAVVLFPKQQAALASLEKHLDVPAMAVDADYVILAKAHVRADYGNPIFAVVAVANADDAGINAIFAIIVLPNFYGYRQKIPGTATAFLARSKNLLDVHWFSFKEVESFVAALYHSNCVKAKLPDIQKLLGIGEPAVKEDILRSVACCQGSLQEIYHDRSGLLAGHEPALPSNSALVYLVAGAENLFIIIRCHKGVVDGQEGAAIRPSQGQQLETLLATH